MAHELEMRNGEAQMVFTGDRQAVWHRLGTQIPDDLAPAEVMKVAGLDWTVEQKPLFYSTGDGMKVETGSAALVRSDNEQILDVVPKSWNPVQNADAFAFFDEFIDAGSMKMDTAGSIRDGRKVWALAKLQDDFELFGGDKIEGYLLFSNPHYFGRCVDIKFTPVRVVCNNTLTMALADVSENQVRHSHRTAFDADRVKQVLGVAHRKMEVYKEQAAKLGEVKYTEDQAAEYMNAVFPILTQKRESRKTLSKQADRALSIVNDQPGAEYRPGTFWNLYNSATYITSNEYGRKDENRLDSLWYGQNAQRNVRALGLALKMAQAA